MTPHPQTSNCPALFLLAPLLTKQLFVMSQRGLGALPLLVTTSLFFFVIFHIPFLNCGRSKKSSFFAGEYKQNA